MEPYRYFEVEVKQDAVVARAVDTHLDGLVATDFVRRELLQAIESLSPMTLVIDLQNVKRISSSMIESLLVVNARRPSTSVRLTMTDSLRGVFRTLNLDGTAFQIFSSNEQALVNASRSASYFDVCGRLSPPDEEFDMTVQG